MNRDTGLPNDGEELIRRRSGGSGRANPQGASSRPSSVLAPKRGRPRVHDCAAPASATRPGHEERMAKYAERAAQGKPLFAEEEG